jgi:hypothetical protein
MLTREEALERLSKCPVLPPGVRMCAAINAFAGIDADLATGINRKKIQGYIKRFFFPSDKKDSP